MNLDAQYWNQRYQTDNIPWDVGQITPPLKAYFDSLINKNLRILIPGAGRAHEAIYLYERGFHQTYVCDWAPEAISSIKQQFPDYPDELLICSDFFELDLQVDLIVEQTFFCAIPRQHRALYVQKTAILLQEKGRIVGLLFNGEFDKEGPPFGGTITEYRQTFAPFFQIEQMEVCPNSLKPRQNRELFISLLKK